MTTPQIPIANLPGINPAALPPVAKTLYALLFQQYPSDESTVLPALFDAIHTLETRVAALGG
jgi:hypothetical protein